MKRGFLTLFFLKSCLSIKIFVLILHIELLKTLHAYYRTKIKMLW